MSKIDLDDDNVDVFDMTVTQARAIYIECELDDVADKLTTAFDNAQAKTFTGQHKVSYLVIKITE